MSILKTNKRRKRKKHDPLSRRRGSNIIRRGRQKFIRNSQQRLLEVTIEGSLLTKRNSMRAMAEGDVHEAGNLKEENEGRREFEV